MISTCVKDSVKGYGLNGVHARDNGATGREGQVSDGGENLLFSLKTKIHSTVFKPGSRASMPATRITSGSGETKHQMFHSLIML